jgi:hypothetical protein
MRGGFLMGLTVLAVMVWTVLGWVALVTLY